MVNLYSLFHLNSSFSAIENKDLPKVIDRCYWPLLNLIDENNLCLNIESSGSTLLDIYRIDKSWILKLKKILKKKNCEFIGSGYRQIIAPLAPYELNLFNIRKGNLIYKDLIDNKPEIAYVNEQTYSKSLINLYKKNGYKTLIIDWNNSYSANQKWNHKIQYYPQKIIDDYDNSINIVWNNSINFQKFQRFIYGEINKKEFLKNLKKIKNKDYSFSLYGSDAEVFDFRPKRFFYEKKENLKEWIKIKNLLIELEQNKFYKLVKISHVLKNKKKFQFRNKETITNSKNPIIVKKQSKYNSTRWALSGRDDLKINTFCWKMFDQIKNKKKDRSWTKLCDLWSSDFRTHLTDMKWRELNNKIKNIRIKENIKDFNYSKCKYRYKLNDNNENINISSKNIFLVLNKKKGLTIKEFFQKKIINKNIFGTIPQGFYNHIDYDVDFFSGHFTHEYENKKDTDINYNFKKYKIKETNNSVLISAEGKDRRINFTKNIEVDFSKNQINFEINFKKIKPNVLRLFHVTINPKIFNSKELFYATNNGGKKLEYFGLDYKNEFNHGDRVSNIVSSRNCLGATEGKIIIGDKTKCLEIVIYRQFSAIMPMIQYKKIKNNYLMRIFFSASETDDTYKSCIKNIRSRISLKLKKL